MIVLPKSYCCICLSLPEFSLDDWFLKYSMVLVFIFGILLMFNQIIIILYSTMQLPGFDIFFDYIIPKDQLG